jgi:hypothetical protein
VKHGRDNGKAVEDSNEGAGNNNEAAGNSNKAVGNSNEAVGNSNEVARDSEGRQAQGGRPAIAAASPTSSMAEIEARRREIATGR